MTVTPANGKEGSGRRLGAQVHSQLHSESEASMGYERTCLKNIKKSYDYITTF